MEPAMRKEIHPATSARHREGSSHNQSESHHRWRGSDDVDQYLRNEYRAEEGASPERRPEYAQYGRTDRDPRFWGPTVPADYSSDEGFAGAGTAFHGTNRSAAGEVGFEREA